MANNRAVLVCAYCHPNPGDWVYHDGKTFSLLKYYPSDGWGLGNALGSGADSLHEFISKHSHEEIRDDFGANNFRLEYEVTGLTTPA